MSRVINRIDEVRGINDRNKSVIKPGSLEYGVTHRLSLSQRSNENTHPTPDEMLDGPAIAWRFCHTPLGVHTGYKTPYQIAILTNGWIEQLLPLLIRGSHAGGYNWQSIGLCVIGRTHERPATDAQKDSLLWVWEQLAPLNGGLYIVGHDEVRNTPKQCPGKYLPLGWLHAKVSVCLERPPEDPWAAAERAGFVL